VSIIRIQPDQLMLNLVNSFPAVIVTDAGLGRPASQAYSESEAIEVYGGAVGTFISIEEMQLADGDFIFAWSNQGNDEENAEADANWETIQASPLWNTLTAAQNGTAHRVRGHWLGWGIFAAHGILDDLFTYIADVDPAEVSPNPFLTAEAKSTSGECETGYRLLDNPYMVNDPVCVPENPQRVVVLHPVTDLDNLIALGIVPAGTAIYTDRYAYAPYLLDLDIVEDGAITRLGSLTEPNYEVMLMLQPDLIIARDFHDIAALSQIAPTVAYPYAQWRWRDFMLALADAVNRTPEAEALLSAYDARVEAVRAALGEEAGELVVSVVRVRPDGLRLYNTSRALSGMVLESVGLARPEATADWAGDSPFVEISLEELDQADGHIIFVWGEIAGTEEILADLQASPLWQTLEAVQNERVYVVAEPVWFAPGIIGMHLLLDDILTYVAGVDPSEVAPNPYVSAEMGD
jgi:iron complex transport system substrate-binding protein